MNCQEQQRRISALMDGELSALESGAVFRHLAECDGCRTFYHRLIALSNALNRSEVPAPGVGVQVPPAPPPWSKHQPGSWWKQRVSVRMPVVALALCAIMASVLFLVLELSRTKQSETVYVTRLPAVIITAEGGTQ